MSFASDIDAAVRRLERAGGLPAPDALTREQVTPELVKRYQRRARELRAEALNNLCATFLGRPRALLRRALDAALQHRGRFECETTVSTVG